MSVNTQVQVFDQLFRHATVGLALVDEDGVVAEVNLAFAEAVGSSVDELRGRRASSLLPPGSITGHQTLPSEWQLSANGCKARITSRAMEGGRMVLTAVSDLRGETDNRLLGLQESLSLAMQGGRLGIWTRDLRTGKVEWSPELEMIFGLEVGTFARNEAAFFEHVHAEDQPLVAKVVEESIRTGRDYQVEFRFKRADGSEGWMDGRGRTVLDAAGRPVLLAGVGIDITEQKEAEGALKRSREQFQAAAYGSFDAFFLMEALRDESGKIVDFVFTDLNERGEALIGIPREKAIGGRLLELLPGNLDNGMFPKYVQVVETRVPIEEEFGDCAAGHSGIWIHQQTVPLQDGIAITCRDETARKKHELEMQSLNDAARLLGSTLDLPTVYDRLQTLIGGILDCDNMLVSSYDPLTNMVTCSYAWMEGSRADTSIFPPVPLAPEGRGMQSQVIRTGEALLLNDVAEAKKRSVNSVYIDTDGTVREQPLEEKPYTQSAIMVPIKLDGKVTGVVQVMSDRLDAYTEEQVRLLEGMVNQMAVAVQNARLYEAAQRELAERRRLEEELEQRVQERTAELALANAEMQGFTYSVSHDLRAPLRSIISTAMILMEDYGDQVNDDAKGELRRMATAASKMGQLIDDLLQYSRLWRAEIETRPIDLSQFVEEIVEGLSVRHPYPLEVEVEPGIQAHADPLLLRLALENLVDNAYKYAGSGGKGRLWFGRCSDEDCTYYLRDNGIGFDPKYALKIFEPFQRLVLDSEFPGTGIGLANVKRILERHGGRVWAEGRPGNGATFFFTLPNRG